MSKIVGIDLGTTNSLVGVMDAGFPVLIADAEGRRLTPSIVHFPGEGEAPLVGAAAKRVRGAKPAQTVSSIKRFMGRRGSELSAGGNDRQLSSCRKGQRAGARRARRSCVVAGRNLR